MLGLRVSTLRTFMLKFSSKAAQGAIRHFGYVGS